MDMATLRRQARPAGITAAWIVVLLVVWKIIISFDKVRNGVVVMPFESSLYPMGLLWTAIIDAIFLTIVIYLIVQLGRQLGDVASPIAPRLQSIKAALLAAGIMVATFVGYSAYDVVILEPLKWQGAGWVYQLVFWLLIAGTSIAILLQGVRFWYEIDSSAPRFVQAVGGLFCRQADSRSPSVITLSPSSPQRKHVNVRASVEPRPSHCTECGAELPLTAQFCIMCGNRISTD